MGRYKGRKNLAVAGFMFIRYGTVSDENLPAACKKVTPTKVLPPRPSFCFPYTRLQCVRNGQFGLISVCV